MKKIINVMTQKDKDLLLKDLCGRIPHGVKYLRYSWNYDTDQELPVIETLECVDKDGYINHRRVYTVDDIKPYLLPLSSMTEEQKKEYCSLVWFDGLSAGWTSDDAVILNEVEMLIDFYHKNHLDWRGLIPKGLANDATNLNIYFK